MEIWIFTGLSLNVHIRAWQCCVMTYSFMERSLKIISRVYEVAIYFRYVIVFKLKRIMPDRLMNRDSRISYPPWRSCSTHGRARIVPCSRPSRPSRLRPSPCASSRAFRPPNTRRATSVSSCPWCLQPHRLALLAHRDLACGAIRSKAFLLLGITRKAETSQSPTPPTSSAT